ncbi:transcription initiation factor IID, 31kD subunit-domain-containing protein [Xylariomycetidae sp. FL2044]|nr:transcription initiation factor IID, 31kD subunit-domain-containing protein [Xylariomycetidae sp. FL2044]
MATVSQSQTNGVPSSSANLSQSQNQPTQASTSTTGGSTTTVPNTQSTAAAPAPGVPPSPMTAQAPRPRDARTIELLLTSQGVTSYDNRVPLLLLDFAYRHTSSILTDALHLATDPYTTHAGAKPSAASGAAPTVPSNSDATVSTNAINLAIASRQAFQFRGGSGAGGTGGGGASKDWLLELAKARNRTVLPRPAANEYNVRLPNERFVLSGTGWGLKDQWVEDGVEDSSDDDADEDADANAMEGMETMAGPKKDSNAGAATTREGGEGGDGGGGLDEYLGGVGDEDEDEDEEMEEVA